MRCPTLAELPPPPCGKTGWPWTEESPQLPTAVPDGHPWPKISIVTPSYNQSQFIEETIRSVLLQGYPNLEYIIIDGGSKDGSVENIKKYEPWLAYWASEKDRGQSHAINKGFSKATGQIFAWINSDDYYFKNLFSHIAIKYRKNDARRFWIFSAMKYYNEETNESHIEYQDARSSVIDWTIGKVHPNQAGGFWSSDIHHSVGLLDESMHLSFDQDFFVRMLSVGYAYECTDVVGACWRLHDECKTQTNIHSKLGFSRFQYEWTLSALKHLPNKYRRDLLKKLAYFHIRFSQNTQASRFERILELLAALRCRPMSIFDRSFWGSLKRIALLS